MFLDQLDVESIVSGGHRRVRGENHFARNTGSAALEVHTFFLHAAANRFEHGEPAVAFVQMQHAGRDAHRLQSAESADAEQQLLADSDAPIAAVKPRSKLAIFGGIAFHVRIEQQQIAAPDSNAPHLRADAACARLDLHRHGLAVRADRGFHRQLVHIGGDIFFLLPTFHIEPLAEISLSVKQTDANQWDVEIRRALDVIAG